MQTNPSNPGNELSAELRAVLTALGRTLGIIAVYGTNHPSAEKAIEVTFSNLQTLLKTSGSFALGSVNSELTVDGKPVVAKDAPIKALEKRLTALQLSHLALNKGLSVEEFKTLLTVLCAGTEQQVKKALSKSGLKHVNIEDVKYVALREGESHGSKSGGSGGAAGIHELQDESPSSTQVDQIVAFLQGEGADSELKSLLSEPEELGQMILEAAAIRQRTASLAESESLADIVVGCLRRTYDGLRKETEFESAQGKASLAKTMLLVEKAILDKIRGSADAESPGLDRRIMAGIREMEKERQFDLLSTHYVEQSQKRERTEEKIIELIQQQGAGKAREQLATSGMPVQDWQRLMTQSRGSSPSMGSGIGTDANLISTVLEKLTGLMELANSNSPAAKDAVNDARQGISDYVHQVGSQIDEMESKVQQSEGKDRDQLILEISKLTLSLMQPLTVINGSIEAALITPDEALHKDLLDIAYQSGQNLEAMTKRMIALTGYPELSEADGHLNDWNESQ